MPDYYTVLTYSNREKNSNRNRSTNKQHCILCFGKQCITKLAKDLTILDLCWEDFIITYIQINPLHNSTESWKAT